MDPFESLPAEIHDNLLQFFSVKEVLDVLSLVSKSWYAIVASSKVCMSKTKLNLRSQRKTNFYERIGTLKWMSRKEARKFQHLQINCLLDEAISVDVWNFIDSVSDSVETINIRSMKLDETLRDIKLPKLEQLQVMFIPRDAMNSLLKSTSVLKKLILRNEFPLCYDGIDYTPNESTLNSIKECIRNNQKLEELELQGRPNFLSFCHEDVSSHINFNLKKLVVKIEMSADKVLIENEDNLIKLLTHQAGSLQHVYIDLCGPRVITHVFNNLPSLTFIRFDIEQRDPKKLVVKDMNLLVNERIKQLELPYIPLLDDVKEFLDLTPNVEEILVGHANPRLLQYAGKNLPKLKLIVYRYDDCADGCEMSYEKMRKENPEMNQNIKVAICNDFL